MFVEKNCNLNWELNFLHYSNILVTITSLWKKHYYYLDFSRSFSAYCFQFCHRLNFYLTCNIKSMNSKV